nr:beta carbonic anhydrase 5, chloroplastic isoform X4 [Malus domestica]
MADLAPTSVLNDSISNPSSSDTRQIFGSNLKSGKVQPTQLRLLTTSERCLQYKITTTCNLRIGPKSNCPGLTVKASRESLGITEQHKTNKLERVAETDDRSELFEDMKQRFVDFKKHKYMENLEHYQNLAKCQAPKFMVISCADSRVCPSTILGFQPGEAFVVRNIANLVPPFESGPSETNAALEFSVNFLKLYCRSKTYWSLVTAAVEAFVLLWAWMMKLIKVALSKIGLLLGRMQGRGQKLLPPNSVLTSSANIVRRNQSTVHC